MTKMSWNARTPKTWIQKRTVQIKDRQQSTPINPQVYIGKVLV